MYCGPFLGLCYNTRIPEWTLQTQAPAYPPHAFPPPCRNRSNWQVIVAVVVPTCVVAALTFILVMVALNRRRQHAENKKLMLRTAEVGGV